MTKEDIDRIASEYFDDKESEHEMDEVFYLAKKALEERKADVLEQIRAEIEQLPITDTAVRLVTAVLDKHKAKRED